MSDKQKILRGFPRLDVASGNLDFRAVLSSMVETELGKSSIDAQAFAQANVKRYWNWFVETLDDQRERGIRPYFTITGGGTYAFSHTAHALQSSNNANDQEIGRLALARPNVLRQLGKVCTTSAPLARCETVTA